MFNWPSISISSIKPIYGICTVHLGILIVKYHLSILRQLKETVDVISDVSRVLTDAIPEPGFLLMESFGLEGASTIANRSYPMESTLKDISSMYFLAAFITCTCIKECQSVVGIAKIKDNINLSKNNIQNNTLRISTIEDVW